MMMTSARIGVLLYTAWMMAAVLRPKLLKPFLPLLSASLLSRSLQLPIVGLFLAAAVTRLGEPNPLSLLQPRWLAFRLSATGFQPKENWGVEEGAQITEERRASTGKNNTSSSFFFFAHAASNIHVFNPPFHQANDYAADGTSCAERRPLQKRLCPVFGVASENGDPLEVARRCTTLSTLFGCHPGEALFVDGLCRRCPPGFTLQFSKENVWCQNGTNRQFHDLINPFDCNTKESKPRNPVGYYRACYPEFSQELGVPHYYSGADLNMELTMSKCAEQHGVHKYSEEIHQREKMVYNFPLISSSGTESTHGLGYLQCQNKPPKPYSFTG